MLFAPLHIHVRPIHASSRQCDITIPGEEELLRRLRMNYIPVTSIIAQGNFPSTWTSTNEPRELLSYYSPSSFSDVLYLLLFQGGVYFQEQKGDTNNRKTDFGASGSKGRPVQSFPSEESSTRTIIPVPSSGSSHTIQEKSVKERRKAPKQQIAEWVHWTEKKKRAQGRKKAPEDPFAIFTSPPPNETRLERETRKAREAEEKRVSNEIDKELRKDKIRDQGERGVMKVLLLGQGESGKSTTLKSEV